MFNFFFIPSSTGTSRTASSAQMAQRHGTGNQSDQNLEQNEGGGGGSGRERDRQTDRDTERQTKKERERDRQTDRGTERETETHRQRHTDGMRGIKLHETTYVKPLTAWCWVIARSIVFIPILPLTAAGHPG